MLWGFTELIIRGEWRPFPCRNPESMGAADKERRLQGGRIRAGGGGLPNSLSLYLTRDGVR